MKKIYALLVLTMISAHDLAQNVLPTSGNVGIGTTAPTSSLEVMGTTTMETIKVTDSAVFDRPVKIKDSVSVESKLTVEQDVKIKGQTILVDNVKAKSDLKILGTTRMKGDAFVEGNFKFKGLEDQSVTEERFLMIKPNGKAVSMEKGGVLAQLYGVGSGGYGTDCILIGDDGLGNPLFVAPDWGHSTYGVIYTGTDCPTKVGIGTNNPEARLDVRGTSYFTGNMGIGTIPNSASAQLTVDQINPTKNALEVKLISTSGNSSGIGINTIVDNDNRIAFNVNNPNSGDIFSIYGNGLVNLKGSMNVEEGNIQVENNSGNHLLLTSNTGNASMGFRSNGTEESHINYYDQYGGLKGSFKHKVEFAKSTYTWTNYNYTNNTETELMKLSHDGILYAREIKVQTSAFPDYVFEEDYPLIGLSELEAYIQSEGHLPNMPAEAEIIENGLPVGELEVKLVEKIEELTLYIIALEKKYNALEQKINE